MQKTSIKQFFLKYQLAFLSGILIGTSYIPFPPWAILFAYVPLWLFSNQSKRSLKEIFIAGWISQFTLALIGFHWITYTAMEFGHLHWSISVGALLLFCTLANIYIPLSLVLSSFLIRKFQISEGKSFFVYALILGLIERAWPSIFPWNLGYTLYYGHLPAYQLADLIGFEGLTIVLLLFNAFSGNIVMEYFKHKNLSFSLRKKIIFLISIFIGFNALGYLNQISLPQTDRSLPISIIQANIGNHEKLIAEKGAQNFQSYILDKHIQITNEALKKSPQTQLIIWPESAVPAKLDLPPSQSIIVPKLRFQLRNWNLPLLTGGLTRYTSETDQESKIYNALFIFPNHQDQPLRYKKSILLAFGESLPFGETFPWLYKLFPFVSDFGRGNGPEALNFKMKDYDLSIGPQICYEGLFPSFSRGLAQAGTQILVNVTNDSWFSPPFPKPFQFEPLQHLYMTTARAIETRRPMIRSTNTGISTVADSLGHLYETSPTLKEWSSSYNVPYRSHPPDTFYVKYGYWDWALWLLILVLVLFSETRERRKNEKSKL